MAIRLSRLFTGRKKILRIEQHFHGWADELTMPGGSAGVVTDGVTAVPCDIRQIEKELSSGEYAILMVEGGGALMGQVPIDFDFVRALPPLAHRYGTLWHLDEVVTGFRDPVGCFQTRVGVRPDLTSLGKIVGGGLSVGALVGRADIMEAFSPRTPEEKRVKHTGTWNANPLTGAAGIAALRCFEGWEPQKKAAKLGDYLREKGNHALAKKGINACLYGRNSIIFIYIGRLEMQPRDEAMPPTEDVNKMVGMLATKARLSHHLLQRGIATMLGRWFILSSAHREDDIDKTVVGLTDSLETMLAEGTINR
jgi:glutamate-1-semialdehyde 2,1-aminomutase